MIISKQRAPLAVLALLVAVATTDVSIARAAVFSSDGKVSTPCAAGTLTDCGYKDIMHCETVLVINANIFNRSGGFQYQQRNCVKAGEMRLYKDLHGSSGGSRCTARGSDDGEEVPFEDEVCED